MTDQDKDPFELEIEQMLAERERTMAEFTDDHRPMAIYAIVRKDLEMEPGKLASQCMHGASEAIKNTPADVLALYQGTGHGTKLTATVKNEGQLRRVYREARAAGFPCQLIIDRGHVALPHFTGKPILVGVALGPVYKDEVTEITKRTTLVK